MDNRTKFRDLTPFFLYLLFVSTIGPLLFGYHLAELNTPLDIITCKRKSLFSPDTTATSTLPQCIPMSPAQIGVVQSIFTAGGLFGALAAGWVSSRYGRLRTMQLTTVFFIAGPVLEAPAPNIATLAIGRLISGIGAGSSLVSVPIYISEISPPEQKGFFGSFTQIMVNIGILLTQLLGYFLSKGQLWRLVLGIGGAIGLAQVVGLFLSVESPKWLADQGHGMEANRILRKIRANNSNIDEEFASWGAESQDELHDEAEALLHDEHQENTLNSNRANRRKQENKEVLGMLDVIKHPDYAKAVFAVIMIMIAQQLTGKYPSQVAKLWTN
jgi:MFS family permease